MPPKSKTKPEVPAAPIHTGETVHEELEVFKRYEGADGPIHAAEAKEMLGWWVDPGDKFGDDYDLLDTAGRKVRLVHNAGNRWHEGPLSEKYAYELLNRNWAGPTTLPGETVNGETVIISRTAAVKSGQHRLGGTVLAAEIWEKDQDRWKENWPDGPPVLETLLVVGTSDHPKVTITQDNVRARTGADSMYASGKFTGDGVSRGETKAMCKLADHAVRYLWNETGAGRTGDTPYRTQAEIMKFLDAHPYLEDAIRFVYENLGDDPELGLRRYASPGYAAGMLYLMAASATEPDKYLKASPRSEDNADLSLREKAEEFWLGLARENGKTEFRAVMDMAYPRKGDPKSSGPRGYTGRIFAAGEGAEPGSLSLRETALAFAWELFRKAGVKELTPANLRLPFADATSGMYETIDGEEFLADNIVVCDDVDGKPFAVIGGIQASGGSTEEEPEARKAQPKTSGQIFQELVKAYPGVVLLFKVGTGPGTKFFARNQHVAVLEEALGLERDPVAEGQPASIRFPAGDLPGHMETLSGKNIRVAVCELKKGEDGKPVKMAGVSDLEVTVMEPRGAGKKVAGKPPAAKTAGNGKPVGKKPAVATKK